MAMTGITHKDELLYMRDMHQAMVAEKQNVIGVTLILLLACLGAALYWASSFQLEEITRGNAKVIPSSREQIIQSLEGGILSEMLVKEGDVVKQGQPIGKVGMTGRASGPHLHWGMKWNSARIDPKLLIPAN